MVLRRVDTRFLFFVLAGVIVLLCVGIVRSSLLLRNPTALSFGATCDLLLTIPVLYYLLVVRSKRATPITLLPVFLGCLTIAKLTIPSDAQLFLRPVLLLSAPLELTALGLLFMRLRRATHSLREANPVEGDWLERLQSRIQTTFPDNRLLDLVMAEVSVAYFGICGWFLRPIQEEMATSSTCYKKGGWSALVFVLAFLIIVEGSAVHFGLSQWNTTAAWVWNAFDLYALLWLFADYHALRLRPLVLTENRLSVRFGLRWRAEVPLDKIAEYVSFANHKLELSRANSVKLAVVSEPDVLLVLQEPVEFTGLLGIKRQVTHIAIAADNGELLSQLQNLVLCKSK